MSSGEVREVHHPEFAIVTPGRLAIADPATDQIVILSPMHVTEIRMARPAT